MIKYRVKRNLQRILAGMVSAAMTMTMVPDIWLPVHALDVRDEIANTEVSADYQDDSESYMTADTNEAPEGYVPIPSEEIQAYALMAVGIDEESTDNDAKVLLIEDVYPWSSTANSGVLSSIGVDYKKVQTSEFLSQDLGDYSVIVFANDQLFSAYNNYSTFKDNIEQFAELGGVVVFGACDGGWSNGTLSSELPGGVKKIRDYEHNNYIDDENHPIVTAELSDGKGLTDSMLYSNYCSHVSFDETTLPEDSTVILRETGNNSPTLVEYPCGKGRIIASGLTWEHNYKNYDRFARRVMDDMFLYALSIGSTDVNMQPPIAVSVDAPQALVSVSSGYTPNPFDVTAVLKNVSEEIVNDVEVRIVLPNGLKLAGNDEKISVGTMNPDDENSFTWNIKAITVSEEKEYTYKIIVTAENGYEKVVTKTISVPSYIQTEKIYEYTIFSANTNEDITFNGWKSNFGGNIYSGRNFVSNLSELYMDGKVDAVGTISANGWKVNISEKNENIEAVSMPDLEEAILSKAGECTYYAESPSYIQDTNIINGSIMVSGDVTISGTNFEGDCYIIADKDITYNVNNLNTTGRLVLYSRNGNITINGTNINIDGIMYAPKGKISFNANETNVTGRVWGDTVNLSGSIFNFTGSDSDLDLIGNPAKGISKTYTTDEDFSEGTLDGVRLSVPDELTLSENAEINNSPYEKVYGDAQTGNGVKLTYSSDKSVVSENGEAVNITYGLSGFGEIENEENAVDLIILVDESGSMNESRMTNAKAAAKEVVSKMKSDDRCAIIGFSTIIHDIQLFTSDKDVLCSAIDEIKYTGGTNIELGLKYSVGLFEENERQKYIILISDGEDNSKSAAVAEQAKENGIRILAMMIGTGSLQMQTVAINSNGIYKNAPTSEEIGEIMSYFAAEVFNTAGRNTVFKTTVKDKNTVNLSEISPTPANITGNADGSVTLEWNYDRISVDEKENVTIPVRADVNNGFAELLTDTSCVYYDRNGKPDVIYAEDVIIPKSDYSESGAWTAVYDSKQDATVWNSVYWNGLRYGDGKISVKVSASDNGTDFSAPVTAENYGTVSNVCGRYVKLDVSLGVSSDGKTPELFDITVTSEDAAESSNSQPAADIYGRCGTKVNIPINLRGIVTDDCIKNDLAFEWSCSDENAVFADKNALMTSAYFKAEGLYEVAFTVNDGEKTETAVFEISVAPAEQYEDIDPEAGEASAPDIFVKLPQYADRNQKITARIENLNNTEISWYSVIFNNNKTIDVSDDGEFTLTMGDNGTYKVVVRAFDWSGKSDVEEYTITVNSEQPTVEVLASADSVYEGEEAYFTVNTTINDKIKTLEYSLNGEAADVDSDGKYILNTSESGTYTFTASAVTASGKTITASAVIEVKAASTPVVELIFDKESYSEGDDVTVTVTATDENGVSGYALEYDMQQVELDENNSYTIKNISEGSHTLVGVAWNEAGKVGYAGYEITILPATRTPISVSAVVDKTELNLGETATLTVTVDGENTENVAITVDVNGEVITSESNVYEYTPAETGEYVFNVTAKTPNDEKTFSVAVNVVEPYIPPVEDVSCPKIELTLDKEIYYEGDSVIADVTATDNIGISRIEVTVNGEAVSADADGKYVIENAAIGSYEIKATAYDAAGNSAWTSITVPVNKKGDVSDELTVDVDIDTDSVKIGQSSDINISITGGIGEKTVTCTINGAETAVTDSKAVFTPNAAGEYVISVSAVDEAGSNAIKTVTLNVTENGAEQGGSSEEKIVSVNLIVNNDRDSDVENNESKTGEPVSVAVEVTNLPDSEIESLVVTVNGEEISLDENKTGEFTPYKAGEYLVNAILKAKDGNSVDLKYMLYVSDNAGEDDNGENEEIGDITVEISSPEDVNEITAPTDIIGSAKGSDIVKYTLEYAESGTDDFVMLYESTESVDNDVLGKLDPTLMRNGYYDIRLTGYTSKSHISDTVTVYVTGQMKIGNFSVAFQDMDVNVPGLLLTLIRGYDSRDRAVSGDFGYGWNLSVTSADISESSKPSENWEQNPSGGMVSTYKFTEAKAHQVSVDWGNGKTDKFTMKLSPNSSLTPITAGITVSYAPQKGTKSTLEAINKTSTALIFTDGILSYADGTPYAPAGYKLTKQDGTVYYFDSEGNVNKIVDTNGYTLEMTEDGIIHSAGKSIVYSRDSEGRITGIKSPTGKSVSYTYDSNGDLVSVTDVSGNVVRFEYDDHYLTNIIDPRGINVSRNIYDDSGRLIKTIDSDGNEIVYDHNIDGREELITDRNGNVTRYVYDDKGNILSQTDPNGNTVTNSYDSNGNLDKTIDAMNNVTDYDYSESGDLLTLTDAENHTVTNSYNSKGQLTSINAMGIETIRVQYDEKGNTTATTDALGNDINYSYDNRGQLTSVTDEIGTYMNMTYDSDGNVVAATNGAGTTTQFTYDADGNCTSKTLSYTTENGIQTVTEQYFYDNSGNVVKIIDSEGNVTSTEYNEIGKVSCATDEKGRKTSYEYDDFGNLIKITYPDNTTEAFTYDREGNNLSATDRMGRTVTMSYDRVGNLTTKTYPNGASVSYVYDCNYNLVSETGANGGVTSYEYDKVGRNTAIIDALGNRTTFFYNAKSQLESMTDPMGRTYTYSYDDNGNRIKTTYPDGTSVSTDYDARGRITRQSDQHGYNTYYNLDGADRLTSVKNAQGVVTSYTYDEVGNMISVTDGNGNVTSYAYDEFGRVTKTTNALGNSAYTTYDNSGNVLTSTDYAGNITSYTYDNFDRLTSKTNLDGTVSYTYTADGKISAVTDNSGVTQFTYDLMDGLTRVDYPDGNYVAYSYDNACRLTAVTTPFGTTAYEYDLLDRLVRVVDRNGYATVYEYDANGNRTAVRYANGLTTTYDYDLLNRLVKQETVDSEDNVVVQYIYRLGAAGERLGVTELNRSVEYTYDSLYRLTSETITEGDSTTVYSYAYDNVSNRILKTENGAETAYVYNALNQLVSDSETSYEYDLNGNLIRVIGTANSALYEYNAENKLVKATVQNGSLVVDETYTYDYAGNRTSKTTRTSDGVTEYVKYLNDNSSLTNVLVEIDGEGNAVACYTIGDDVVSQDREGKTSFYLYDGHGSVTALVNENGVVTDTYSYDAFGNLLKSTGLTENNYRYCGEQFDSTTGLYYLRARYMDTSTGRFISQDSYQGSIDDPVSLHKYLYANSNPVMYTDPSGYFIQVIGGAISYGISAVAEHSYNTSTIMIGQIMLSALVLCLLTSPSLLTIFSEDITEFAKDIASGDTTSQSVSATYRYFATKESDKSKSTPYVHRLPNRIPKGRIYQEAFVLSAGGALQRSYVKLTFKEAIIAFTANINTNRIITMASRFAMSKDKIDKAKQACNAHIFGIYTHNKSNAAALAAVFGSDMRYEYHGKGQLYHFHDSEHLAHIWFGSPI